MIPSLEELATFLTTPAESGLCLSKSDLIGLARSVEGSLRVNERKRMLVDIFIAPSAPLQLPKIEPVVPNLMSGLVGSSAAKA